jgi:hypothetical protein
VLDFNTVVVQQVQNIFSRPITITPYGSQPGKQAYNARGVYVTTPVDVVTEGQVVYSDARTVLDIRSSEYPVHPGVRDWIFIPAHMSMPSAGPFEVQDVDKYHDGRARLTLRAAHIDEPRPWVPPR